MAATYVLIHIRRKIKNGRNKSASTTLRVFFKYSTDIHVAM